MWRAAEMKDLPEPGAAAKQAAKLAARAKPQKTVKKKKSAKPKQKKR